MLTTEKTYQSILHKLSRVPVAALPQIDLFLQQLVETKEESKTNREEIMSLAGSWDEVSEPTARAQLLHGLLERMKAHPIPADAPRWTREELHERR